MSLLVMIHSSGWEPERALPLEPVPDREKAEEVKQIGPSSESTVRPLTTRKPVHTVHDREVLNDRQSYFPRTR